MIFIIALNYSNVHVSSRCIIWWTKLIELEEASAKFSASKQQIEGVGATLIVNK